ncbi:MAG: helix-turn-helix domain-containing protein [Nitratireductor sp.]|uniref:helix-turn-helix domain-containing protein n=1 Tax=Nitratireductor sp. TaxID=1872084 RepID=UPI0026158D87|nr:helix-turn-helix domain-containing protein [Nitratireductor sp.]MCV0349614.1 helix-turn-helix domain-containing protein [Nitratireductor sp.]
MPALTQANPPRVHRWTYAVGAKEVSVVLPDGCVDLVVLSCGRAGSEVLQVTDWDFAPRLVRLDAGTCLTGYRLRPGTTLDLAEFESERTLQRRFKHLSLPTPAFWRQLGRARRAVQALPCRVPLAEIAAHYGYSDQAHMTREFVRWFGWTPVQLRRNPAAIADLAQPGLGNWSLEIGLEIAGLT